jgi:hypothetical protein
LADTAKRDTQERRYLLGSLSEDDSTRLEDAFFADDAKFEELEALEYELIDDYVRGELSPDERRQIEAKLRTSPRLVERVHFARILAEKVANLSTPQPVPISLATLSVRQTTPGAKSRWWGSLLGQQPAFRMAMATCLILLLLGGAVLVTGWLRLRNESERIKSERAALLRQIEDLNRQLSAQEAKAEQQTAELQRERDQRTEDLKLMEERAAQSKERTTSTPSIFATIFLIPGQVRGSGANPADLIILPQTNTARIQLDLEKNDYPAYDATLKSDETIVLSQHGLKAHVTRSGPRLLVSLPSRLLQANRDYVIHVDGLSSSGKLENFNDYQFRVTNKLR